MHCHWLENEEAIWRGMHAVSGAKMAPTDGQQVNGDVNPTTRN